MKNAHTYTATVRAHITILQEVRVCVIADNKEEVVEKAIEKFGEAIEHAYGWADYDECHVGNIEDLGALPF